VAELAEAIRAFAERIAALEPPGPPVAALEIQGVRVELTASVAKALTEALANYHDPRDRGFCEQCGGRRLDEHLICAECGSANSIFGQMLLERASRYEEPPALP
jgi:hypothetical protein